MLVKLFVALGFVSVLCADAAFTDWAAERDSSGYYVPPTEPPSMKKPEDAPTDDSMKAFWIVFGLTVVILLLAVHVGVIRQRNHLILLCKRTAQPREVNTLQENQQEPEFPATSRTNQPLLV